MERSAGVDTSLPSRRTTTTTAWEFEAKELDAQIAWHYAQIKILKAKRNAIVPLRRLPNELLIQILTIFAVEAHSDALYNLKWSKIMKVCHHWHELIMAAQHLWAYIDLKWKEKRLFDQLERSGAAPLSIKLDVYDHSVHYIPYIMQVCTRIRELNFEGEAKSIFEFIASLPEADLPILSALTLRVTMGLDRVPEGLPRNLPHSLFDGRLPRLRELTLASIAVPWSLLRGLTSLSLTETQDSSNSTPPTFSDLLDMLRACPQLSLLRLDDICPPSSHHPCDAVYLPSLQALRLRAFATSCQALLEHLHIPSNCTLSLFPSGLRSGAHIRGLLVPIRKHLRSPGAQTPLLLKLGRSGVTHCTTGFVASTVLPDMLFFDNIPLFLNCHPTSEGTLRQMLTKILNAVPSDAITHLDGRWANVFQPVTWRTVIAHLPSLEIIYLALNHGAVNCLTALCDIETIDPEHRIYPRIRRLHIRVLRLDETDNTITELLTILEEYLTALKRNGTVLERLEFDDDSYVLSYTAQDVRLQRMFALMEGEIIVGDRLYDPIEREKRIKAAEARHKAWVIENGFEIQ
ncbi:F-box domain-containing protein [Favolaschia claudopus]|uniref:F-box domain-containing protein n=1 Tax=Favolaschia claudopus TaxID=2862362 RepID=A0AAW0AXS5_9AGAR